MDQIQFISLKMKVQITVKLIDSMVITYYIHPSTRQSACKTTIKCSECADNTLNPIRKLVDQLVINPHPDKTLLRLNIGTWLNCFHVVYTQPAGLIPYLLEFQN